MQRQTVLSVAGLLAGIVLIAQPLPAGAAPQGNTKLGRNALRRNIAPYNTAIGASAISPNVACTGLAIPSSCCLGTGVGTCENNGSANTAVGAYSLTSNSDGAFNTAVGYEALYANTTGEHNTAVGNDALKNNVSGAYNTAIGNDALLNHTSGVYNTAVGAGALYTSNGIRNTGIGVLALGSSTIAADNVAIGYFALRYNLSGFSNVALGISALSGLITGDNNIAIGPSAGSSVSGGNNNIFISNSGVAGDTNTIRIGNSNHAGSYLTHIQGIYGGGVNANGVNVMVDNTGKLGVGLSSARFKENIVDIGDRSSGLMKLRPVRFRYKEDPSIEQYGLVAEEVAGVYPELVLYDDDGRPQSVRYHLISTMLLNEAQKQAQTIAEQRERLVGLERRAKEQARQIDSLTTRLADLEAAVRSTRSSGPGTIYDAEAALAPPGPSRPPA